MSVKRYYRGVKEYASEKSDTSAAISSGTQGAVVYQTSPSVTGFIAPTSANQVLLSTSNTAITWASVPSFELAPSYAAYLAFSNTSALTAISTDGTTWSQIPSTITGYPRGSSGIYAQGQFVVLSNSGGNAYTSTNGVTWVTRTMPAAIQWIGLAYGKGTYVAVARSSNSAATSTNGITWTARTIPTVTGNYYASIVYGNGMFVAAPGINTTDKAAYSTDGITWLNSTLPSSTEWSQVAFGAGKFVIRGVSTNVPATSTDGITWTASAASGSSTVWLVYGANGFVGVGNNTSNASVSTDGITWTNNDMAVYGSWRLVMYGGGRYVAILSNSATGQFSSSTNGITWTAGTSSISNLTWCSPITSPLATPPRRITGDAVSVETASYTVSDNDKWVNLNTSANHTLTLPSPGVSGREIVIKQVAAFTVNSATANVLPLTSNTPGTAILSGAGKYAKLVSDGLYWVIMEAN